MPFTPFKSLGRNGENNIFSLIPFSPSSPFPLLFNVSRVVPFTIKRTNKKLNQRGKKIMFLPIAEGRSAPTRQKMKTKTGKTKASFVGRKRLNALLNICAIYDKPG